MAARGRMAGGFGGWRDGGAGADGGMAGWGWGGVGRMAGWRDGGMGPGWPGGRRGAGGGYVTGVRRCVTGPLQIRADVCDKAPTGPMDGGILRAMGSKDLDHGGGCAGGPGGAGGLADGAGRVEKRDARAPSNDERNVLARCEPKRDDRETGMRERHVFSTGAGAAGPAETASARLATAQAGSVKRGGAGEPAETVSARLATAQAGSVKRAQLLSAGVAPNTVKRQLRVGALHRKHTGVYVVGHLALPELGDASAALLACGEGSLISHRSAAHLWALIDRAPAQVDVTLVGRRCRPQEGIKTRSVDEIDPRDVRRRRGLPVTGPARTLIDLALDADSEELERAIAEARAMRLIRDGELESALRRSRGRRGAGRMRAFLRAEGGPALTRSGGERRMRALLRAAGLPQPLVNASAAGYEVDFLWPAQRVIVEVDGYDFHRHRRAFELDRRKDMALRDAGFHVIRITGRALVRESLAVVAHIAREVDRRSIEPDSRGPH